MNLTLKEKTDLQVAIQSADISNVLSVVQRLMAQPSRAYSDLVNLAVLGVNIDITTVFNLPRADASATLFHQISIAAFGNKNWLVWPPAIQEEIDSNFVNSLHQFELAAQLLGGPGASELSVSFAASLSDAVEAYLLKRPANMEVSAKALSMDVSADLAVIIGQGRQKAQMTFDKAGLQGTPAGSQGPTRRPRI